MMLVSVQGISIEQLNVQNPLETILPNSRRTCEERLTRSVDRESYVKKLATKLGTCDRKRTMMMIIIIIFISVTELARNVKSAGLQSFNSARAPKDAN